MSSNYGHLNNDESNESEFKRNPVRRSLRLRLTRVFSSGSLKSLKSPGYSNLSDSPNSPEISSAIKTRYSWQNNNLKNILSNSPRSSVSSTSCNDSINSLTFMEIIKPPENNDENNDIQWIFLVNSPENYRVDAASALQEHSPLSGDTSFHLCLVGSGYTCDGSMSLSYAAPPPSLTSTIAR
ncbi:hypothetical protein KQX54_007053 [Cotesia glomerata]|uniref:Uncharacterized protein n=1 Tax=Cotesia glomerata TaxID=32391 RepID=A0AAV7ILJ9_COTGL|nr:hypothetical protein KQX54_007053 [Cotesia glomerata]